MVNPADVHGRRLAMIACGETPDGRDDVRVFAGIANWDGTHLTVLRQPEPSSFQVPDDWLDRLKPVAPELRATLLDAEYCFSVTIGPIPEDANMAEYLRTRLKWPTDEDAG